MVAKVTWGHGVLNAVCAPRGGRLAVFPGGSSGFMWDVSTGYPNWGWTQATVDENEKLARALLAWLTSKTTGANVLIYSDSSTAWGIQGFQNFLTRTDAPDILFHAGGTQYHGPWTTSTGLGHTVTFTDSAGASFDWTLTEWKDTGGTIWNPTNYDLVVFGFSPSALYHQDGVDAYLDYGGACMAFIGSGSTAWSRYGITAGDSSSGGGAINDYMCIGFPCAAIGPDDYRYGVYSSPQIKPTTNTIGGTETIYSNSLGLWRQY